MSREIKHINWYLPGWGKGMVTGEERMKATCFLPASRVPPESTTWEGSMKCVVNFSYFMRQEKRGKNHSLTLVRGLKLTQGENHWDTTSEWEMKEDSYRTTSKLANAIMVSIQNKLGGSFLLPPFLPLSLSLLVIQWINICHVLGQYEHRIRYLHHIWH